MGFFIGDNIRDITFTDKDNNSFVWNQPAMII